MKFNTTIQTNIDQSFSLDYKASLVAEFEVSNKHFDKLEEALIFLTNQGKMEIFHFLNDFLKVRKKHLKPFALSHEQLQSFFAFEKAIIRIKAMDCNLKQLCDYILHASHIIQYMMDLYNVISIKDAKNNFKQVEAFEDYLYSIIHFKLNPADYVSSSIQ